MAAPLQRILRPLGRAILTASLAAATSHCAHETPVILRYQTPRLGPQTFVTADHQSFGYRRWAAPRRQPKTIVIALHGVCGAAIDYESLGSHLVDEHPATALYAYELRGQGNDPVRHRRGDIPNPDDWFHDLYTFTRLLREKYPRARIVWFGESMGALIAAHACHRAPDPARPPCDALVLSSPIVRIRDDFPKWKQLAVNAVASGFPTARVPLDALTGGAPLQMTHDTIHAEQAETNSWHIERHTLRLLVTLGDLVKGMQEIAPEIQVPTLVLHAGKDFASRPQDVAAFCALLPKHRANRRIFYPESHHLLMYDRDREAVIDDATKWIDALRRAP